MQLRSSQCCDGRDSVCIVELPVLRYTGARVCCWCLTVGSGCLDMVNVGPSYTRAVTICTERKRERKRQPTAATQGLLSSSTIHLEARLTSVTGACRVAARLSVTRQRDCELHLSTSHHHHPSLTPSSVAPGSTLNYPQSYYDVHYNARIVIQPCRTVRSSRSVHPGRSSHSPG